MKYKVVLVPFPFDDLSSSKVRPAVCLTDAMGDYHHVVLAFITSKVPDDLLETDLLIASDDEGFETVGFVNPPFASTDDGNESHYPPGIGAVV